jgi:hypothetical protein
MLGDLLERSAPARVINVSSGGMYNQRLPGEDLQSEQKLWDLCETISTAREQQAQAALAAASPALTISPIATRSFRGPLNGRRACATSMLSTAMRSPACHVNSTHSSS